MSRPITYILLLVVLWCQDQTRSADGKQCSLRNFHRCAKKPAKCPAWVTNFCNAGNRKRSDINDLAQETDLRAKGERPDIQEASGGETRGGRDGGGRDIGGYRGSREGDDDLRSAFNDRRRQPSDERQLVDIGNDRRGHSPRSAQLDSVISRLRSLLGTTDLDVDDRGEEEGKREERQEEEEEEEEEEPQEHSNIDIDRGCNETQILLNEILADIESRFDTQQATNSEN